jgi:hypothetical protein
MRLRTAVGVSALSLVLTVASLAIQRVGPTRLVEGEGFCPGPEACRVAVLAGGFPAPYLLDNPQVSVPNALFLGEDDFRPGAFALDAAAYLAVSLAARWLWRRARRHSPS